MNRFVMWLLETSIATAFLALLATSVSSFFSRRPAIQHLIWFAVLLKFVLPPVIAWPASAQSAVRDWFEGWTAGPVTPAAATSPTVSTDPIHAAVDVATEPAGSGFGVDWFTVPSLQSLLLAAWAVGMSVVVYRQLRRLRACQAILGSPLAAPAYLLDEVLDLSNGFGMRSVPVQVVGQIASPFVWCFGWLRLVWPQSLTSPADVMRSRSILAHELGHVRRGDHWIAWIELFASLIWWWNPVFWFVRNRLRESAEMSCDAMALSALPDERLTYAELFLELSSSSKPGVPVPVLGVSTGTPSSFERRLTMILSEGVSGKLSPWGICVAVALLGFGMPSLLQGEQKDFENTERKTGNVIYLVDDDGDGVADRPAASVESEFIDGDPTLGKEYFVVDTDAEGRKTRRKVTIIHSKPIENGIVIHTLGRLILKAEAAHAPKSDAVKLATERGGEILVEKSTETNLRLESELKELRNEYDRLRERYREETAVQRLHSAHEVERREALEHERQALQKLEVESRVRELHDEVERLSTLIERSRLHQDIDTIRKRTESDTREDPRKDTKSRRLQDLEMQKAIISEAIQQRHEAVMDREKLDTLEGRIRDERKKREELRYQIEIDRKVSPEGIVTPSTRESKRADSETPPEPQKETPKAKLDVKKPRDKDGNASSEAKALPTEDGIVKQFRMRRDALTDASNSGKSTATAHVRNSKLDIILKLIAPEEGHDTTQHLCAFETSTGHLLWVVKLNGKATQIEDVKRLDSSLIIRFDEGARLSIDAKTGKVLEKSDFSSRDEGKELESLRKKLGDRLLPAESEKP